MQRIRSFLWAFFLAFFCLSLMIMAAVLWVTPYSRPQEAPAQSYIAIPKEEDSLILLAIHAEGNELRSLSVINVQTREGQILLKTFPPSAVINGENLGQLRQREGNTALIPILSSYLDWDIQRFALVSDQQISALIDRFGPAPVTLEQPLQYSRSDIMVTLEPGTHNLNGEQCLRWLASSENSLTYARRSGQLLQTLINQNISVAAGEQAQETFLTLLDSMDSDLSLGDYDRCHSAWAFMARLVEDPAQQVVFSN